MIDHVRSATFWFLTRIIAVLLWAIGMVLLTLAVGVVAVAYYIKPNSIPPNCWVYAAHAWLEAIREGYEAYWVLRLSRLRPSWLLHAMVCRERDHESGIMHLESFVPVGEDAIDVAWWQVHRWTTFKGKIKHGDSHEAH